MAKLPCEAARQARQEGRPRLHLARGDGHVFFRLHGLDVLPIAPNRTSRFNKAVLSYWPGTMVGIVGQTAAVAGDPAVEPISFVSCPARYQRVSGAVCLVARMSDPDHS
jgi:hypothetical protein